MPQIEILVEPQLHAVLMRDPDDRNLIVVRRASEEIWKWIKIQQRA